MSLYVQRRGEKLYLYFQAGRKKLIYLGPVEKARKDRVNEAIKYVEDALEYTEERAIQYRYTMQKLKNLLKQDDVK